ncbi:MAG: hypothetical protein ACKV19_16800 [Verrucomicrobiales bacterium]
MTTAADFCQLFRIEASGGVEYSYDSVGSRHGVMISGSSAMLDRVGQFASGLPYAGDWAWAMRRFSGNVRPDAFLLRIDCSGERVAGLTLYCRFPTVLTDESFDLALSTARPFQWLGPAPSILATTLGVPGPRGVGFRVSEDGEHKTALYFKLGGNSRSLGSEPLAQLATHCGLPEELAQTIREDIQGLYPQGPIGVVGFDSSDTSGKTTLKFDPANVPLRQTFNFLRGKGTDEQRISELTDTADSLRAMWVSYLGVKYNAQGFVGWRVYFSVKPGRVPAPDAPSISVGRGESPTIPLPHY